MTAVETILAVVGGLAAAGALLVGAVGLRKFMDRHEARK